MAHGGGGNGVMRVALDLLCKGEFSRWQKCLQEGYPQGCCFLNLFYLFFILFLRDVFSIQIRNLQDFRTTDSGSNNDRFRV